MDGKPQLNYDLKLKILKICDVEGTETYKCYLEWTKSLKKRDLERNKISRNAWGEMGPKKCVDPFLRNISPPAWIDTKYQVVCYGLKATDTNNGKE